VGEVAVKNEVNQVPAKAGEKAAGNKALIRQDIHLAAMNS
jgi:hypothetical protein